jgi:hypothetical protein
MTDRQLVRARIAVLFIGMVSTAAVFLPGLWVVAVIVTTGIVVFGLVGGP